MNLDKLHIFIKIWRYKLKLGELVCYLTDANKKFSIYFQLKFHLFKNYFNLLQKFLSYIEKPLFKLFKSLFFLLKNFFLLIYLAPFIIKVMSNAGGWNDKSCTWNEFCNSSSHCWCNSWTLNRFLYESCLTS